MALIVEIRRSVFTLLDESKQYTPNTIAVLKVNGRELKGESYTGEIGGKKVALAKGIDNTLAFYIPNLSSGTHTFEATVDGASGTLELDITVYTPVASPRTYVPGYLDNVLREIDTLLSEFSDNPQLATDLLDLREKLVSHRASLSSLSEADIQLLADVIFLNLDNPSSRSIVRKFNFKSQACQDALWDGAKHFTQLSAALAGMALSSPLATSIVGAIVPGLFLAKAIERARVIIKDDYPNISDTCWGNEVEEVSSELQGKSSLSSKSSSKSRGLRDKNPIIQELIIDNLTRRKIAS